MLDDIIEIILEVVLGIVGEVLVEVNVPKPVKIGLSIIVMTLLFGMSGIMIGIGVRDANMLLAAIGGGLLVLFAGVTAYLVRKYRKELGI
ncbi:MAG: hypothetical protein IJN16_00420 [Lachnospiraceae bacterium]|nr:hypothetical protein [Lachnospiraceae bacterium]